MVPGKYFLVAIRDGWDLDWRNPQVLKPYLDNPQILQLAPADAKTVTVDVQPVSKSR
jgi:hypothetical protein